jgi:hypothetical protein
VVSGAQVARLAQELRGALGRDPTTAELRARIRRHAQDEALYREALARGMDRDDPAIRQRLVRRMEADLEDPTPPQEPSEAALTAWLNGHSARYRRGPVVSFTHTYTAGDSLPDGAPGEPFPLGEVFEGRSHEELLGTFGEDFARAVESAPIGRWVGPVRSRHGLHRTRVTAREEPRDARLDEVRERVRADLLAELLSRRVGDARERLLAGWHLRVEEPPREPPAR